MLGALRHLWHSALTGPVVSKPTVPQPVTPHRQRRARAALCQPLDVLES